MRHSPGNVIDWLDTRIESGFSNFLHIDRNYSAHGVMRRIFSLARKHGFQSVLIESLDEATCPTVAEENSAMAVRDRSFTKSDVQRLSFFRCRPGAEPASDDFIGSAVFKTDHFTGLPRPRSHVFETLLPPHRKSEENNFIHCGRTYDFKTAVGDFSASGVLYAQQNDLTFVCAHVALRTALSSILPGGDITY